MTKKCVDGFAVALCCTDSIFYYVFSAGEKFENDKRFNIADHIDLTEKAWEQKPDFMQNQLPIYCDIYFKAKLNDNGYRSNDIDDTVRTAQFVTDFTNKHPELPDAWDFMDVYIKYFHPTQEIIVLPNSKRIVELKGLTIDEILKT